MRRSIRTSGYAGIRVYLICLVFGLKAASHDPLSVVSFTRGSSAVPRMDVTKFLSVRCDPLRNRNSRRKREGVDNGGFSAPFSPEIIVSFFSGWNSIRAALSRPGSKLKQFEFCLCHLFPLLSSKSDESDPICSFPTDRPRVLRPVPLVEAGRSMSALFKAR